MATLDTDVPMVPAGKSSSIAGPSSSLDTDVDDCAICRNNIMDPCIECYKANRASATSKECTVSSGIMTNHAMQSFLESIVDKDKLNGVNFLDWDRKLRIYLMYERKEYVLDNAIPEEPAAGSTRDVRDAYQKHLSDANDVAYVMLLCMEDDLQKQFMDLSKRPFDMMAQIKEMFKENARTERYNTLKDLLACKMQADTSVNLHVLRMKRHLEHLTRIGLEINQEMSVDIVLQSLPPAYDSFIMNYLMFDMDKTISELRGMLVIAEMTINKGKAEDVLMVKKEINFKKHSVNKAKAPTHLAGRMRVHVVPNPPKAPACKRKWKENPTACFYCNEVGHWKRDCKKFQDDQKKGGGFMSSDTGR